MVVTGASRGLGKAISLELARQGASVVLVARNSKLLEETERQLPRNDSQSHKILPINLLESLTIPNYADHFQDVSVLVNCAGMTNYSLLLRLLTEEICNTVNLNLVAPMLLAKMAYKPMVSLYKKNPDFKPTIVNISSMLALPSIQIPGSAVYAALKAGVDAFTLGLSNEMRGRVRVNSILPGLIKETDMGTKSKLNVKPVSIDTVVSKVVETIKDQNVNGECILVN